MTESTSQKRLAENEVVFRKYNESIQHGFDRLQKMADEDGQHFYNNNKHVTLHFYCECSDEDCRERILIRPKRYNEIHQNRAQFIIIPGHETKTIEKIVSQEDGYSIIEKYDTPPEKVDHLHDTDVKNV